MSANAEENQEAIAPVMKTVVVPRNVEDAFRAFTQDVSTWWPLATHSVGGQSTETCSIEGRVGGRFYERLGDGAENLWGEVLLWEPPNRLAYTWHPGRGRESAQTVEVSFTAVDEGTRVELVHGGWEKLGDGAVESREGYDSGWDFVLVDRYVSAAS